MELSFIVVTTQWNFYCLSFHQVRFHNILLSLFLSFALLCQVVMFSWLSFAHSHIFHRHFEWVSSVLKQENKLQNLWSFIFSTFIHYNFHLILVVVWFVLSHVFYFYGLCKHLKNLAQNISLYFFFVCEQWRRLV